MKQYKYLSLFFFCFATIVFPQGSVLLVGGGSEEYNDWSDKPYKWLVEHAPNRKILVLHYADTTTWFSGYFPSLSPCSVSNLFINTTELANDSTVYKFILQHDGVFLRGGDQAQYVLKWKNTLTQQALKEIFSRGGVIGGTSAGEMVLSNVSYTGGNSDLGALLRIPSSSITLVDDFLPFVKNSLSDSHTSERGRIGRLPAIISNYKNKTGKEIMGIAIDENTALAIDSDGIGEVMGAITVAILRYNINTIFKIETGKPFSLKNMSYDQLLPGYKINLNTGKITMPGTAQSFSAKQIILPKGAIILDGSGSFTDWGANSGSIKKLQTFLTNSNDTVGIISSPSGESLSNKVNTVLISFGIIPNQLFIDEAHKNDITLADKALKCKAFIFVGNSTDSLAALLNPTTAFGKVFAEKLSKSIPLLFLSDDVMLAGEKAIGGIYSNINNAYYGALTHHQGLNIIKGFQFISRFYQNPDNTKAYDYTENRIDGLFWSMVKLQLAIGLVMDAGAYVTFYNNKIEAGGVMTTSMPVIMIDARKASFADFASFRRPGKQNAVQNASLIGASLHVIRQGDLNEITEIKKDKYIKEDSYLSVRNFPNPFNPSTKIYYSIPDEGRTVLKVFDVLGREVVFLFDKLISKGNYEISFDARRLAAGIYFLRLEHLSNGCNQSKVTKLILQK